MHAGAPAMSAQSGEAEGSAGAAPGILIVEDERIAAKDLEETLRAFGHRVIGIAASADEALAQAAQDAPTLVLMDIRIQGPRDGIALAEILRQRFHASIIYLTAHADQATV